MQVVAVAAQEIAGLAFVGGDMGDDEVFPDLEAESDAAKLRRVQADFNPVAGSAYDRGGDLLGDAYGLPSRSRRERRCVERGAGPLKGGGRRRRGRRGGAVAREAGA